MTSLAYDIISHYADDIRCWQEQFDGFSLEHLGDVCYNYLAREETEQTAD